MFVETPSVFIGVHQIEEYSFGNGCLFITQRQYSLVNAVQAFMFFGQHFAVKLTAIAPATNSIHAPVIEYRSPSVSSAETFAVHSQFSKLLTKINHHRIGVHTSRNDQSRDSFTWISCKEIGSDALFVMVFQEVQHLFFYSVQTLPAVGDGCRGFVAASYIAECIV